ncbi:MAG TPA: M14 family metallocarboxypeptidase [Nevskiaceae bacterium]|nr:M14 family metallocarboxypeptidase [Nevskiaceae bacterium]
MTSPFPYADIGTPGTPWGAPEKALWRSRQTVKRRYAEEVLPRVEALGARYERINYGHLPEDPARYPLVALRSRNWQEGRPVVLVTGGVHGYETSGVHGALRFLETEAAAFEGQVNLIVAPCVSPWAYETIQRWNPQAVDPNRSFGNRAAPESAALLDLIAPWREQVQLHVDLHETTDSDESEFRPALAARDGKPFVPGRIPDGFYLVDDQEQPQTAFQSAVIAAVAAVTPIAPAEADGTLIGSPVVAPGVIEYPLRTLGLCAGVTAARFKTTTEVYPDSPRTNPEECVRAQCVAVAAAIRYLLEAGPA